MAKQLAFAPRGQLWFGDNLEVLRRHFDDESVDLIYLDPPFKSNKSYNILFAHRDGRLPAAQVKAFDDTWTWNMAAAQAYQECVEEGGDVSRALRAFREILGTTDMLAYLAMMAPRLKELYRVLKPTGSLYLHCDPTAAHYLRTLLDCIFGPKNFRNEIIWRRTSAHSDTKQGMQRLGRIHDVIFFYAKSPAATFNPIYTPYSRAYLESEYRHRTPEGRYYKEADATAAKPGGDTQYEWRVKRKPGARWEADLDDEHEHPKKGWEYHGVVPYRGRFWAYAKQNMRDFARAGKLRHRRTGVPRLMLFADEMPGVPLQDVWDDIPPVLGAENVGYPTQKPMALLQRVILASSNEGDLVLDPFCGCGTTVHEAQKLRRRWVGIDVTEVAINVIRDRLKRHFGVIDYTLRGEPTTLDEAKALAHLDKHEFQGWVCRKLNIKEARKKGADRGVDGEIIGVFDDGTTWRGILSVKGGGINVSQLRDLTGTVTRENADMGLLVTLLPPTKPMQREAADAGFGPGGAPRLQILTVQELLEGKRPTYPEELRLGGRLRVVS